MAFRLQGKVTFVTGGGTGIGAATAVCFAQEGATVVLCSWRREPLDAVVANVSEEAGFTGALADWRAMGSRTSWSVRSCFD